MARALLLEARVPGRSPRVSLALDEGERARLVGPTGSGKTSLLLAAAGLLGYEGRIEVSGLEVSEASRRELASLVGLVSDEPEKQFVAYRVADEVAFAMENLGFPPDEIREKLERALGLMGVSHLAWRPVHALSSGEKVRVALASAIAHGPKLLLVDNAASRLDPPTRRELGELLDTVASRGTAVLEAGYEPREDWKSYEIAGRPRLPPPEPKPKPGSGVVLSAENVWYKYSGGVEALRGASLEIRRGELVAVMGRNGAGKSTLARIAAGLLKPAGGSVKRRCRAVYVPESPDPFLVGSTPREDVEASVRVSGRAAEPESFLGLVGVLWAADKPVYKLSLGARKLVAVASAIALSPCALLLDEPTVGLDARYKRLLANALKKAAGRGMGVAAITHDEEFAREAASRAFLVENGRTVFEGGPEEVRVA